MIAIDPSAPSVLCHEKNGWVDLEEFPRVPFHEPFSNHQMIVVDGALYLAGGSYRVPVVLDSVMMATLHCDHFFRYDRYCNAWTRMPNMITKRSCFSMVHLDGYIYVIGGKGGLSSRHQQNVERFNLQSGVWEEVPNLPVALRLFCAVAYKNVLLVYGIRVINTMGIGRQGSLFAYDPARSTWTSLASEFLPINRELENGLIINPQLPPALVIEEGECYRVIYYGSKSARVSQLTLNLGSSRNQSATFSPCVSPEDQELVGQHNTDAGAFTINKHIFVNLNGYIHRLDVMLDNNENTSTDKDGVDSDDEDEIKISGREDKSLGKWGLLSWQGINNISFTDTTNNVAAVEFTFDKYQVMLPPVTL